MGNCKTCEHAIFDQLWGEYKCKERKTTIYILLNSDECHAYKEDKSGELKLAKPNLQTEVSC